MKSFLMCLDGSATYSEIEINEEIQCWNRDVAPEVATDHVTVRHLLIDYGLLERTANGGKYQVGFPPRPAAFDLEIDEIDVRATVAAYRDEMKRRQEQRPTNAST